MVYLGGGGGGAEGHVGPPLKLWGGPGPCPPPPRPLLLRLCLSLLWNIAMRIGLKRINADLESLYYISSPLNFKNVSNVLKW